MKRLIASIITVVSVSVIFFSTAAFALDLKTVNYYDENGNPVMVKGMYCNNYDCPLYGTECCYANESSTNICGGCGAYYYDSDGNLKTASYYDFDGNIANSPIHCKSRYARRGRHCF